MKTVKALLVCVVFLFVPVAGLAVESAESLQTQHMKLLKKIKSLYDHGDQTQAIVVCDEYFKTLGTDFHPQVWFLRGNAFHKLFKKTKKNTEIAKAIESYEKGLAIYRDVKTFMGLDSVRYQIDGLFNLGLLYEEQYKSFHSSLKKKERQNKEWKIVSNIFKAISLAEMYGEWRQPIDDQRERYLDRSLQTFLDMILLTKMPDVYRPLSESICIRGRHSKQKSKYEKYAGELSFDPNIKACVHWIRGKELAESVQAYDRAIEHFRKGLSFAQSDKARATICRQIADIYLKKDSLKDKKLALDFSGQAWALWQKHQDEWGHLPVLFETYGVSLKAVAVGNAMLKKPNYDQIIQLCHQALRIPEWKDSYYMNYLLAYASYQKGEEDQFYRHGKLAVKVILDKYKNGLDKIQSEEEKEVLLFWVNALRGSGRILEAMRYKKIGDRLSQGSL